MNNVLIAVIVVIVLIIVFVAYRYNEFLTVNKALSDSATQQAADDAAALATVQSMVGQMNSFPPVIVSNKK